MRSTTILLLVFCAALVGPAFLQPTGPKNITGDTSLTSDNRALHREKRFIGALLGLLRVAAGAGRIGAGIGRVGASAGRIGAGVGRVGASAGRIGTGVGRVGASSGRIGAGVGRVGASAGRIGGRFGARGGRLASAGGRSVLGGARFGRTLIRVGAGGGRMMSLGRSVMGGFGSGARSISNLARRGIRFGRRHRYRILFELALLGSHIGISEMLRMQNQQMPEEQTPVSGQNYVAHCTLGWTHLESQYMCYLKPEGVAGYPDAKLHCYDHYVTLATPVNSYQNYKVSSVSNSTVDSWIGLDDLETEGRFKWVNGKRVAYTRWASGYPKPINQQNHEDCVSMGSEGKWRHKYCLENKEFVCQTFESRSFDVFDTRTYKWELVFRGTAGVNQSVYEAYTTYQDENVEAGCRQFKPNQPCNRHYRNNFVIQNWNIAFIDTVAVVFYKSGNRVAHTIFNGKDTDALNWFSKSKIISSSFRDIKSSNPNYASIPGHATVNRRFFLNKSYGGCGADHGWMVAVDGGESSVGCPWEKTRVQRYFPAFLYSTSGTASNWGSSSVDAADTMAIFVKYINDPQ